MHTHIKNTHHKYDITGINFKLKNIYNSNTFCLYGLKL